MVDIFATMALSSGTMKKNLPKQIENSDLGDEASDGEKWKLHKHRNIAIIIGSTMPMLGNRLETTHLNIAVTIRILLTT